VPDVSSRMSEQHANVIVNAGNASSKDIRRLADKLKEKVFEQFGIMLQEEVIQIGEF
jgi:UDP-N-acetylmuramate dehydrogenase